MGFLSKLFGKKSDNLTKEQVDEIDEKVEETQEKHVKDRAILSDLKKPSTKVVKATKPVAKKASKKKASPRPAKQSKKKAKKSIGKKSSRKKRKR